ncbi:phosphotransferase [Novosphingobium sp. M1R2S20]|uniref:Phosphotransferase n=1 Tax=Novosphingobium rhizovicinum TaxID=3228928 RepID=A0ABV3REV3_9SPHN
MMETTLPTHADDLTLGVLNKVICAETPDARLSDFSVVASHVWGDGNASSAGRIIIRPVYVHADASLPDHLVLKVARAAPEEPNKPLAIAGAGGALYENEVAVYRRLRPATFLEAPMTLGGAYDPSSNALLLVMEDLRDRDATFASVTVPTSLERMRSILDQLAVLHARYWQSAELTAGLSWMEKHTSGRLHQQFNNPAVVPRFIADQVEREQFKKEMVERLGTSPDGLFRRFQSVQRHQTGLPQTVCHGDTHIGNTYILPGEKAGLLDWQLASQGFCIHDVSYVIATGLSVEQRRTSERELLAYYREQLIANGCKEPPASEELWREYRMAIVWGLYIGWLTTPVVNYGWEVSVLAHLRLTTAYEDLETSRLVDELDA